MLEQERSGQGIAGAMTSPCPCRTNMFQVLNNAILLGIVEKTKIDAYGIIATTILL
jgi:hypothetical protein